MVVNSEEYVKNWFERNDRKTLIILYIIFVIFVDLITGLILIPKERTFFRSPHYFYHHDLLPNKSGITNWGDRHYPIFTNSLGFRDDAIKRIPLETSKKRIVFMGDSFVEGIGVTYEESFTGILNKNLATSKIEILNAGVSGYGPKFYYLKTKYLIERKRLVFNELYVFIDISDAYDSIQYSYFRPYELNYIKRIYLNIKRFLINQSYLFYSLERLLFMSYISIHPETFVNPSPLMGTAFRLAGIAEEKRFLDANKLIKANRKINHSWSTNKFAFEKWGVRGMTIASSNMKKLVQLCKENNVRMTIAVHPWPSHIYYKDIENVQVKYWRMFSNKYGIDFLNYFTAFIDGTDPYVIHKKYFIKGDIHWNVKGHELVAKKIIEKIKLQVSDTVLHGQNETAD